MTTIYLINNSLTLNNVSFPDNESLQFKREKRLLSIEGEKESEKLANDPNLEHVQVIYSSPYVMSIATAKYLAKKLGIEIQISSSIGERVLGELGDKKIRMVTEMQENDFYYKLFGGESLNEVKNRMLIFLKEILKKEEDKTIAVFTHNVAITSLLSEFCEAGYNLDNRLILNYQENAIIDGAWDGINMIELKFNEEELVSIIRKK